MVRTIYLFLSQEANPTTVDASATYRCFLHLGHISITLPLVVPYIIEETLTLLTNLRNRKQETNLFLLRLLFVLEVDLSGGDQCSPHEDRESRKADRIVFLSLVRAAGVVREGRGVVKSYADEEHGQTPA